MKFKKKTFTVEVSISTVWTQDGFKFTAKRIQQACHNGLCHDLIYANGNEIRVKVKCASSVN